MDGVIGELREHLTHGHNIAAREKIYNIVESLVRDLETDNLDQVTGKVQVILLVVQNQSHSNGRSAIDRCKYLDILVKESRAILQFCKVTGSKYCNTGGDIMLSLTSLFKHTYQNVKELINGLEDVSTKLSSTEDCNIYLNTLDNMASLTKMLYSIDIMATVNIWKAFKRLYQKLPELLKASPTKVKTFEDIVYIALETSKKIKEVAALNDHQSLEKLQIVFRFFINTFMFLKEMKKELDKEELKGLYALLLSIQSFSYGEMNIRVEEGSCRQIFKTFCSSNTPLLHALIEEFVQHELAPATFLEEFQHEDIGTKQLVLLTKVMEKIADSADEVTEVWMFNGAGKPNIFDIMFHCINNIEQKVFINQQIDDIFLYEYLLSQTCAFCSTLTNKHFQTLETWLLECVTTEKQLLVLFATDLWCFVARWGPPKLCWNHFQYIGKLVVDASNMDSDTTKVQQQLTCLFKRLFWFLPDEFHVRIQEVFPLSQTNLFLWSLVPMVHLKLKELGKLVEELVTMCLSALVINETTNGQQVKNAVKCLQNLCYEHQLYELLPVELTDSIAQHIEDFWRCFESVEGSIEMDEELFLRMLELTIAIMPTLTGECQKMILSVANKLIKHLENSTFLLFCCEMLSSLKYVKFAYNNQNQCLSMMADIFNNVLANENFIIQCYAMQALKEFAEVTPYTKALAKFLPPTKKKEFALFLKKTLPSGQIFDTADGKLELYDLISQSNDCDHVEIDKVNPENEHKLKEALQVLSADVENIRNLLHQSPGRPPWLNCDIQKVIESLQDLRKENT